MEVRGGFFMKRGKRKAFVSAATMEKLL